MRRMLFIALCAGILGGGIGIATRAHPGGLQYSEDGRACHACQTDCAKWLLEDGEMHVHYRAGVYYEEISFATYRNKQGQLLRAQGGEGVIVEHDPGEGQPDPFCWDDGTNGNGNSKASPSPSVIASGVVAAFQDIIISEVLPGSSADSFIELHNTGDEHVYLSGFWLSAKKNPNMLYAIPEGITIAPGEYLAFFHEHTGIVFSSAGDSAQFLAPDKSVIVSVVFDAVPGEGISLIWDGTGNAYWTAVPTPNKENKLVPFTSGSVGHLLNGAYGDPKIVNTYPFGYDGDPRTGHAYNGSFSVAHSDVDRERNDDPVAEPLHTIRFLASGTFVKTKGVVSALPGTFNKSIFYLAGSGIGVVLPEDGVVPLAIGDTVRVTGLIGSINGGTFLVVRGREDIERISEGIPPLPHTFTIGELSEQQEGFLVILNGTVRNHTKSGFMLEDGNDRIGVVRTEHIETELADGISVFVTGIVAINGNTIRILPRDDHDIRIDTKEDSERANKNRQSIARFKRGFGISLIAAAGILYTLTRTERKRL